MFNTTASTSRLAPVTASSAGIPPWPRASNVNVWPAAFAGLGPSGVVSLIPAPRVSKMRVGVTGWYSPPDARLVTCAEAIGVPPAAPTATSALAHNAASAATLRSDRNEVIDGTVIEPSCTRASAGVERRLDRLALDDRHQPLVLGIVDDRRLVDQHHRDVVADVVAATKTRVVEDRLALEVVQRALVVGAREDFEQLGRQRHVMYSSASIEWFSR